MNSTSKRDQIFDLIGKRPGIRAVEIADLVDCDIEQVDVAIADALAGGIIIATEIIAPNGKPQNSYRMLGAKVPEPPAPKRVTHVDRAIEFIKAQNGKATSSELHALLGLKATEYASSYLASALNAGKLIKQGKWWYLPETAPVPEETPEPPATKVKPVAAVEARPEPTPTTAQTPVPAAPQPAIAPAPVVAAPLVSAAPPQPAKRGFACALWSDGRLQLVIDGRDVMLTADDTKRLCTYLERGERP